MLCFFSFGVRMSRPSFWKLLRGKDIDGYDEITRLVAWFVIAEVLCACGAVAAAVSLLVWAF